MSIPTDSGREPGAATCVEFECAAGRAAAVAGAKSELTPVEGKLATDQQFRRDLVVQVVDHVRGCGSWASLFLTVRALLGRH